MSMSTRAWSEVLRVSTLLLFGASLVACGGGGGESADSDIASVEGAYEGNLSGSLSSSSFQLLVLENGEYWSIYGNEIDGTFYVEGFIQGSGSANGGTFSSGNARDYSGYDEGIRGSLTATYSTSPRRIEGQATSSSGSVQFVGAGISGTGYDYNQPASLSTIQGPWTLVNLLGETMSLSVSNNGAFSASSGGCALSGTVTPRASGKNVFNVDFRFGGSPCLLPNEAGRGIAVAYPLTNGTTQLLVAAVNGSRAYGTAAFGTR